MGLGVLEIAILLCWGLSILAVVGTVIYLIAQRTKKK
jgi:hypothetical protein